MAKLQGQQFSINILLQNAWNKSIFIHYVWALMDVCALTQK